MEAAGYSEIRDPDERMWNALPHLSTGVFLNFYSWAQENLSDYDPLSSYSVQLKDLLACAKAQNVYVF